MPSSVLTCLLMTSIFMFLVLPTYVKLALRERRAAKKYATSTAAGRNEPASIRPLVDRGACMGSGACVTACPEDVLGIVNGQVQVIAGSKCIGHGVCARVCPVDAIQLVFGSEKRGIDIPEVGPDFQTNVPGLYVAGELGGMGLIANAVEQGQQAMTAAAKGLRSPKGVLDVVIVGAGPAGMGAGLKAQELNLDYLIVEQDDFGGAVRHYPRQKLVMTRPMKLPGYGKISLKSALKEELIDLFEEVVQATGLKIRTGLRVDAITPQGGVFSIRAGEEELRASRVILAIGRRGTPRKLNIPGEEQEKVTYRLLDPERYRYQHLLIVGGGDSAVEAAVSLGEQEGNKVTLAYRGAAISRPKEDNVERLRVAQEKGQVEVRLECSPVRIEADRVLLKHRGEELEIPNDFIFVMVGGVLPTKFLQASGIQILRHHGRRVERVQAPR